MVSIKQLEEARSSIISYTNSVIRYFNLSSVEVESILLSQLADIRNLKIIEMVNELNTQESEGVQKKSEDQS